MVAEPHRDFERQLRTLAEEKLGRSLKVSSYWYELARDWSATVFLCALGLLILPASITASVHAMSPDLGSWALVFPGFICLFLFISPIVLANRLWDAYCTNSTLFELPANDETIFRIGMGTAKRHIVEVFLKNLLIVVVVMIVLRLDFSFWRLLLVVALLSACQMGCGLAALRWFSREGSSNFVALSVALSIVVALVLMFCMAVCDPPVAAESIGGRILGIFPVMGEFFSRVLPTGWALEFMSGGGEGSSKWYQLPLLAIVCLVPWIWHRELLARARNGIREKISVEDEPADYLQENAVFVDEETGERWEAQRSTIHEESPGRWKLSHQIKTKAELMALAGKGELFKQNGFGSQGFIESCCAAGLTEQERCHLDALVDWSFDSDGVGFTESWWSTWKWFLRFFIVVCVKFCKKGPWSVGLIFGCLVCHLAFRRKSRLSSVGVALGRPSSRSARLPRSGKGRSSATPTAAWASGQAAAVASIVAVLLISFRWSMFR